MQNGAIGTIEATKTATGAEDELRFELHGSKGALRFNTMHPHHLGVYDATVSDKPFGGKRGWTKIDTGHRYQETNFPGAKFSIGWLQSHVACLFNFIQSVAKDEPGNPGLGQGIYIQQLLGCIRESASTNNWVSV
jgi:predicted dehydrogenase